MSGDDSNPSCEEVIAEYLAQARDGKAPDRRRLLQRYPNLADELGSFFAEQDQTPQQTAVGSVEATLPVGQLFHQSEAADGSGPERVIRSSEVAQRRTDVSSPFSRRQFGDYELLEEVARGGMGVVYRARQVKLNRIVALKMILAGQLAGEQDVRRFHAEAEAAATLDHPGIVPIFEVGEHEGHHYFSMGFIDGVSLAGKIKDGPLPTRQAVEYAQKVAEAMAYAHQRGVIHRDLKPANVLLDQNGEPKVTDFGLAKRLEDKGGLTASGEIVGTPSYMPPEQAAGTLDAISEATDVYLLGALLYAMVTGRPPFQASSPVETIMQVLEQEPVRPRLLNAGVPTDVETITLKCLQKDPQRRYQTASALAAEYQRFLNNEPIHARPISNLERVWRWSQRRRALSSMMLVTSVVSVLLVSLTVWGYFHERSISSDLAVSLKHEQQLTERLSKLVEFIHNGEKVRRYDQAVERASRDPALGGALAKMLASSEVTSLRKLLNDPFRDAADPSRLAAAKLTFLDHDERADLQAWVDAQLEQYDLTQRAEVFAWFVQDPDGLQIARSPLGENNVGNNYAWRAYFHGEQEVYQGLGDYLRRVGAARPHLRETRVSTAFKTQMTDEWVVAISTPVHTEEDPSEFVGVVGVFLYVTPPEAPR